MKLILALAVSAMLFSCNSKSGNTQAPQAQGEVAPVGSIVYIQMDSLIAGYDMANDLRTELEAKVADIQGDLNKQQRAFESDANEFQTKVQKCLLTQSQAELQNRQLNERLQALQNEGQIKQNEIAEEQAVLLNKVFDAVQTYLTEYNKTHNYALILTTSAASSTVIVGNPSLDITNDVLIGLNEEYAKNKKSGK